MSDVKLYHPDADSKKQITVREDAREVYESEGWLEVGAEKADAK